MPTWIVVLLQQGRFQYSSVSRFPFHCLNNCIPILLLSLRQEPFGASRVLQRISSCMPRPVDSGGPSHSRQYRMLLCCLRRTLKPSASAISISKLYQHFRVRDHPYGLQDSLPTLSPSCSLTKLWTTPPWTQGSIRVGG
jgi:hypothetical protein